MTAQPTWTRPRPGRWGSLVLIMILATGAIPLAAKGLISGLVAAAVVLVPAILPAVRGIPFFRRLGAVTLLWVVAQVASDLWNGTQIFSGMAAVGPIAALMAAFLYWAYEVARVRIETLIACFALAWAGLVFASNQALLGVDPWKYGMAPAVTVFVLALLWRRRAAALTSAVAMAALMAVSLAFDSRLYAGLHFVLLCAAFLVRRSPRQGKLSARKRGIALIATAAALYLLYPSVASAGLLGQRAQGDQLVLSHNGASFLIAQRPEMPQALHIFATHPLIGIGSNAVLDVRASAAALAFTHRLGASNDVTTTSYLQGAQEGWRGYATHSAALDAAVHAGVLAFGFWVFLWWATWRGFTRRGHAGPQHMLLLLFVSGLQVWDSLFSPLTAIAYMQLGLVLFLLAIQSQDGPSDAGGESSAGPGVGRPLSAVSR